jgi:hypothetical protein
LGIEATGIGHRGSAIPNRNGRTYIDTFWEYSSKPVNDCNLDNLTTDLLSKFTSKVQIIEAYIATHPHVRIKIDLVVYSKANDFPVLHFDSQLITFLGRIHASIDCDIYVRNGD